MSQRNIANSHGLYIPKWRHFVSPLKMEGSSLFGVRLFPGVVEIRFTLVNGEVRSKTLVEKEARRPPYGLGKRGGITISRRPNKFPSIENAPGPKRAIPIAVMTMSKAMSEVPNDARGGAGIHEKTIPTTQNPTSKLANGVRNPMIMPAPLTRNVSPTAHTSRVRSIRPDRSDAPSATAMPPSAARIRSSPMPGWPPGKVENSLCSGILPLAHTKTARRCNLSNELHPAQPPIA